MATHRMPILGWASQPNSSNVFFQSYDVVATNDVWDRMVLTFNDTATRDGIAGGFTVPKSYVAAPVIVVVWTAVPTSGNVVWDFDYRAVGGNDTESLDQTSNQESITVTDAAPTSAHRRLEATMAMTAGNMAVDDEVEFELFRDGTAADTMAGAAHVFAVLFEWSDA